MRTLGGRFPLVTSGLDATLELGEPCRFPVAIRWPVDARDELRGERIDYGSRRGFKSRRNGADGVLRPAGFSHTRRPDPIKSGPTTSSSWQNATNESFNGKFRDECLNMQWFSSTGVDEHTSKSHQQSALADNLMTMSQIPDVNRELAEVGAMFAMFDALRRER